MSLPNIPDISPAIDINREDMFNLLLASVALEELGLAHLINAEAEKIQFVLGTLEGQTPAEPPTLDNLLEINRSVNRTQRNIIKKEMLLQFKLEDILNQLRLHVNTATVTAVFNGQTVTDRDSAYYHTGRGGVSQ